MAATGTTLIAPDPSARGYPATQGDIIHDFLYHGSSQSGPSERPVSSSIDQIRVIQHRPGQGVSEASSSRTRLSARETQPARNISQAELLPIPAPSHPGHAVSQAPTLTSDLEGDDGQGSSILDRSASAPTSPVRKMLNHFRNVRQRIPWSGLGSRKRRLSGTNEPAIERLVRDVATMTESVLLFDHSTETNIHSYNVDGSVAPPSTIHEPQPRNVGIVEHTQPDEVTEVLSDQHASKRERLDVKRRQTTLQRKTLKQRQCLCDDGCHCMGSKRTTAPGSLSSRRRSIVPSHTLEHLLFHGSQVSSSSLEEPPHQNSQDRHVAFTGAGLDSAHPTGQGPAVERLLGEEFRFSRQSTSTSATHDSQATTAINSSSSGDQSSRQQSTRANSLPLQPFIELLNRYLEQSRPEVLAALRDFNAIHPPDRVFAVSETMSDQEGHSRTASPSGASADRPSTPQRASTISLSHLPDPSDEQDNPASEDNSARTSGAPTIIPADDSSQRTPTAQSPAQGPPAPPEPQVSADELASEIEQLASASTDT
ncbi:Serine/arginine repetitive matrix protein 2 [Xylographa pallens]|nr:Serine/arginine repetitive matrix protein 2 [Xylographa pallens]